jgi:HTH-type transcriptional repressor of NAD biosynthesis genes
MTMQLSQYQRGLVVGKFCPLHRGHEMLIRHAIAACEQVLLISYTKPEFANCEPAIRESWLSGLFPTATVLVVDDDLLGRRCAERKLAVREIPHSTAPDEEHREFVGWLCWRLLGCTVNAVFTSESYGDGFAAALSAYFHAQTGAPLSVQHVCVDQGRKAVPISGTRVRAEPHLYREFLSPAVYSHFVKRICFLGGESSGKSTLAAACASRFETDWVAEFGRELWDRKDGKLELEDMLALGQEQVSREAAASHSAREWLFCDTSPLTTLFYSIEMFGEAAPALRQLAESRYEQLFLCAPDFAFVQDGTRRGESFRSYQHAWYVHELTKRGLPFTVLSGPPESRIDNAVARLRHGR